tara:strand:- start:509 stop:2314 length:1806 start_codon:yes stop_codon:yes gene_type:complete
MNLLRFILIGLPITGALLATKPAHVGSMPLASDSYTSEQRSTNRATISCVCNANYSKGDRVRMLVTLSGAPPAGTIGTVACGASIGKIEVLVVRWDNYFDGGEYADDFCTCETEPDNGNNNQWSATCDQIELVQAIECKEDINSDGFINVNDLLELIGDWGPCNEGCNSDQNEDGYINVLDLLQIIGAWGDCPSELPLGTCLLPDASCDFYYETECYLQGGRGWVEGGDCIDSDFDRILDIFELGDCTLSTAGFLGTDPLVADTDGDGISDGDEFWGTYDGLALDAFGCSPCRKDILIETDWVYASNASPDRNKLHINQVNRVVSTFANAPVLNPDGSTGVTIHIDYGQSPYSGGNSLADANGNTSIDLDTWQFNGEYPGIKLTNFATNRHGYFHYCVLADAYSVGGTLINSSGLGEISGDDFIVTVGQWEIGDFDGTGNTLVHELGHNLGLRHGGNENVNYKPNYNSVMNYRNQWCGVDTDGDALPNEVLNYSDGSNSILNENALIEANGVTGIGPAIDWNENGFTDTSTISYNINCEMWGTWPCGSYYQVTQSCGNGTDCGDSTCDTYSDFNDWANINYSGISDDDLVPPEIMHCIQGH